jgi:hypothetical protein
MTIDSVGGLRTLDLACDRRSRSFLADGAGDPTLWGEGPRVLLQISPQRPGHFSGLARRVVVRPGRARRGCIAACMKSVGEPAHADPCWRRGFAPAALVGPCVSANPVGMAAGYLLLRSGPYWDGQKGSVLAAGGFSNSRSPVRFGRFPEKGTTPESGAEVRTLERHGVCHRCHAPVFRRRRHPSRRTALTSSGSKRPSACAARSSGPFAAVRDRRRAPRS